MIVILSVEAVKKVEKDVKDDHSHACGAYDVYSLARSLVFARASFLKQCIDQFVSECKQHKHSGKNGKVAYPHHAVSGSRRVSAVSVGKCVSDIEHRIHKQRRYQHLCRPALFRIVQTYGENRQQAEQREAGLNYYMQECYKIHVHIR